MNKNHKEKSNRAQADLFELLVCQYICSLYRITFSYSDDLSKLLKSVLDKKDGKERLATQNNNFITIKPEIKSILNKEIKIKGKIINVIWTGRHFVVEQSTSDIDAEHKSKKKTRFSIKSITRSGSGTLKNIGLQRLESFFGFNFFEPQDKMWSKLQKYIFKETGKNIVAQGKLKKTVKTKKKFLEWAKNNGKQYQRLLNNICFESFNKLSKTKKIEFLNYITDCYDEDLYVIIVNNKGVVVYKPVEKQTNSKDRIKAKKMNSEDVGYTIYINNKAIYRVQTNNTNGIGISSFCQRVFLV